MPPTHRTIIVKGDSELVVGQIKGAKRCNETLRRDYDKAQDLLAKLHDRRTTIEPVHSSTGMQTSCPTAPWTPHSDRRHRPTATRRPRKGWR
ncbi:hypothetical protein DIPPA_27328 [Diplonema papillatum]|nr:hypothetical protein DIPPA_27328 [Diplonema papillatum]